MAGITVTKEQLAGLLSTTITDERFTAIDAIARRLIRSVYRGDITTAEGRVADVLDMVYTAIASRLVSNPTGALNLGLGTAQIGFGVSDDTTAPLTLTKDEARALRSLSAPRPSYVQMRKLNFAAYEAPIVLVVEAP